MRDGEKRLRNENGWWLIGCWISFVNALIWVEKGWGRNVGGDDNGNCKGGRFFCILRFGVVLVRNRSGDEGDVCAFVKP